MRTDYFLGLSEEGFHRIVYTEWGKPNNTHRPIICAHGLTRNRHDFDSLAKHFSYLGCHLYCPDIVGRGDSDWMKSPMHYTYEQYIADMNALIAHSGAKTIDWIGSSMGGLIGMFLAAMPNSPIRRLVLNDIGPQVPAKGISRLSRYAGRDPEFNGLKEAIQYYKMIYSDFGDLSDEDWHYLTEKSIKEIRPGTFSSKVDPGVTLAAAKSKIAWQAFLHPIKAMEGTLFDVNLWQTWRNIKCPVLVLHGEQSDILLPEIIDKMQATHDKTEVLHVPNAGHAPALLDQTHQEMIYRWLAQHD